MKKFFDIIPPNEEGLGPKRLNLKKPEVLVRQQKKLKLPGRNLIFIVLFFLFLLGASAFYFFSKIKIEIWPKTEVLEPKTKITVDSELKEQDLTFWLQKQTIPGNIFEDLKSGSQEFSASGKVIKEEKAKGIIRVYNAYSTSPRTLVPSRFVSADGKLFWSVEKIVIPGAKYEKGKLIPGEVDVKVEATQPGEDYNIGPSTFALPALAGGPLYTAIYAKSFSSMIGGFKGEVSQVTKDDLEKAENILTEKVKEESKEFLKRTLTEDFILFDSTISQEVLEKSSSRAALAEAESFNFQIKVKSKGLGFKKSDLEKFAKALIGLNISEDKKIQEESLEINYSAEAADKEAGKIILDLKIKAKIYSDIDLTELKKALLGKSAKESKIFLENLPEVSKIDIKYWPFWQRKVSENLELILKLD